MKGLTNMKRRSGVLLPITALPNSYGIGSFGQSAYMFVDFLVETGQRFWQILPLTTTSYGDSPYQSFSAIAGNTNLIDFELLEKDGLLDPNDYKGVNYGVREDDIDYALLFEVRRPILEQAVQRFSQREDLKNEYMDFENRNESWLTDYAEFMAIKEHFNNVALQDWPDTEVMLRNTDVLNDYRKQLSQQIFYHKAVQYFFFKQWNQLKTYANERSIQIIGDMPIYVAVDSVEVWTKPQLFQLDEHRRPLCVAGVPADEFSSDGQLWGNPLYDWAEHERTGYSWWIYRIHEGLKLYDCLRMDHFKGFSDYWHVPGDAQYAREGHWVPGPGYELFKAVKEALGDLPIIAEDLGNIDEKTRQLLMDCGYPGMKVLQMGFNDLQGKSLDIPHRFVPHSIAYVGTHDNAVANEWYENLDQEHKEYVDSYIHRSSDEPISKAAIRTIFASVSDIAIVTMQDLLDLGKESRMNFPSTVGNNWRWRLKQGQITEEVKEYLLNITRLYDRENRG